MLIDQFLYLNFIIFTIKILFIVIKNIGYTVFPRNIAGPRCNACLKQTLGQIRFALRYCINLCPQYIACLKVTPGQIRFESN